MKKYNSTIRTSIYVCPESDTFTIKKFFSKTEYYLTQIIKVEKDEIGYGTTINIYLPNFVKQKIFFGPTLTDDKSAQELYSTLINYTKIFQISKDKKEIIIFNKNPRLSHDFTPVITISIDDIIDYRPLNITDLSGGWVNAKFIVKLEITLITKDLKEYTIPYIFKTLRVSDPIAIEAYKSYQRDLDLFSKLLGKK